jgi:hypothetical protein
VPGLHPVLAERGYRPGDRECLRAVLPADPADQAVVLQFGELLVLDAGRLEQLTPGHGGWRAPGPAVRGRVSAQGPGPVGESFPDHLQRKV